MDKAFNLFINSAMIVLAILFVLMIVSTVMVDNERAATSEACTMLGGIPLKEYSGGIICLDKNAIKTPSLTPSLTP
jgi:hypothetical protein